jgi:hypothetical protein
MFYGISAKDKSFNVGWVLGGAFIMFATNFVGGMIAGAAGVETLGAMALLGCICFAVGGFVIGYKSAGQTILEAGLAAAVAAIVCYLALNKTSFSLISVLIGALLPFGCGLAGGWIGEKVQGEGTN